MCNSRIIAAVSDVVRSLLSAQTPAKGREIPVEPLETRRLFATLVVNGGSGNDTCVLEVDAGFINATMNGINIPQPRNLWDDIQINCFEGDDTVIVHTTGDEPVDISLGTGTDLVQITPDTDDLDNINARVRVFAGTDAADDLLRIFDTADSGNDTYTIVDDGPMKLRKASAEIVWWGEGNLGTEVLLNDGDNTVNIDSTVSITATDESLTVGGVGPSFGGGNDTVNFTGSIGASNVLRFNGGTGSDVFNVTGDVFSGGDTRIFMDGGFSTGDTLNITDPANTGEYVFNTNGDIIDLFIGGAQAGRYQYPATEVINISSTSATVGASYEVLGLGASTDLSINAGAGDDSLTVGDGSISTADFGTSVDITFNGQADADAFFIQDSSNATAGTYEFGTADTFDHAAFGQISYDGFTTATVNCGTGADTIIGNFNPGLGAATINGGGGADSFTVTPDVITEWQLNGVAPTTAPGDTLTINAGTQIGTFTPSGVGAGTISFPVRDEINFTGMENFPQPAAAPGPADLSAADDAGTSSTDNITNDTSLNFTGTGAPANATVRLFRDGTEVASATATAGGAYTFANVAFPTGDDTFAMTVMSVSSSANLLSPPSTALNVRVDTIVPVMPGLVDLASTSDSGFSNSDNITNDNTPIFSGVVPTNDIVRLFTNGVLVGSDTTTPGGGYSLITSTLADGSQSITTRFEDLAGNQSLVGPGLVVTIDTVAPANPAAAPDLAATSDLGSSNTDNVTRDVTPTFTGTAPGNHIVRLLSSGVEVGFVQLPLAVTTYSVTSSILADGNRTMTTRFEDIAGNSSAGVSPALNVLIDTVAPTLTAPAAFNFESAQNLRYAFSENVGATLSVADLSLINLTTATAVPSGSIAMNYVPNTATFTFPGFANGTLPDANYRARMTGDNLSDVAGNSFVGVQFDFFFLNGDANRDRIVDIGDFSILATRFNQPGTFSQGNFNYDALVDIGDFSILASKFNQSLPVARSANVASRPHETRFGAVAINDPDDTLHEETAPELI